MCVSQTSWGLRAQTSSLAFGVRRVELAESNGHVPTDDNGTLASLDDNDLQPRRVARRRDKPDSGKQLELAGDWHVLHARRINPLANSVVSLAVRVVKLPALDVDWPASEAVVATTVVEVQVRVDHDVNASEVNILRAQWLEPGIKIPLVQDA